MSVECKEFAEQEGIDVEKSILKMRKCVDRISIALELHTGLFWELLLLEICQDCGTVELAVWENDKFVVYQKYSHNDPYTHSVFGPGVTLNNGDIIVINYAYDRDIDAPADALVDAIVSADLCGKLRKYVGYNKTRAALQWGGKRKDKLENKFNQWHIEVMKSLSQESYDSLCDTVKAQMEEWEPPDNPGRVP